MNSQKDIWIFLSHSHEDYEKVRVVRNMLEEQRMRPIMFFLKCLDDKDEITDLIHREIDCRTRFILCDSPNASRSEWVKTEIEYIKSTGKGFEIIDLSDPEEKIRTDLISQTRKMRVFISYHSGDIDVAKAIYNRLVKYDIFTTWFDQYELRSCGDSFAKQIHENLQLAIRYGYVICLLSENSCNPGCWTYNELRMIDQGIADIHDFGKNVLPVYLDKNVELDDLYNLNSINGIMKDGENFDSLVDQILLKILNPGNLLTYASNFERGNGVPKDIIEADRLKRLYFSIFPEKEKECANRDLWTKIVSIFKKRSDKKY